MSAMVLKRAPAMTGATGSRIDRTDTHQFLFYVEIIQAGTEKGRCTLKICLSDKLVVVALNHLLTAVICSLGQPSCIGIIYQEEGGGAGQESEEQPGDLHQGHLKGHYQAKRF